MLWLHKYISQQNLEFKQPPRELCLNTVLQSSLLEDSLTISGSTQNQSPPLHTTFCLAFRRVPQTTRRRSHWSLEKVIAGSSSRAPYLFLFFLGPLQGLEPDKKVSTSCVFTVCLQRGVCMELDLALRLLLSYFQGSHMQRVTAKEEPWVSF